jgi:hypothetical protein
MYTCRCGNFSHNFIIISRFRIFIDCFQTIYDYVFRVRTYWLQWHEPVPPISCQLSIKNPPCVDLEQQLIFYATTGRARECARKKTFLYDKEDFLSKCKQRRERERKREIIHFLLTFRVQLNIVSSSSHQKKSKRSVDKSTYNYKLCLHFV